MPRLTWGGVWLAYMGNLRQHHLAEVLRVIGDGQRRGRLVVERSGLRADIYCEGGSILHVWRSGPIPPLAQRWINGRLLTPQQVGAIGTQAGIDPGTMADAQFVQVAAGMGFVSQEMIAEWAMSDIVDLLSVLFSWRDGDYRFEEGLTPPPNRVRVPLPIPSVLSMTVQRVGPWQSTKSPITLEPEVVLDYAELDPNDPQPVQLSRDQWRILTLIDGESSLLSIAQRFAAASSTTQDGDPQRAQLELNRQMEMVLRVASELVSEGIAVVYGQNYDQPMGNRWQAPR